MSRPSLRLSWRNFWRSDMPFTKRCRVAVQNNIIKAKTHSNCCGNHGDPGC